MKRPEKYCLNKLWFRKHYRVLMFLLNFPVTGIFLRKYLDVPNRLLFKEIIYINENTIHYNTGTITLSYYNKNIIGWKIFKIIEPAILILHLLDSLILDKFFPKYSFGYTIYNYTPEAGGGNFGQVSVDGYIDRNPSPVETFSTIRGASLGTSVDTSWIISGLMAASTTNYFYSLVRGVAAFYISENLIDVVRAYTNVWLALMITELGDFDVHIVGSTLASPGDLALGDYRRYITAATGSFHSSNTANLSKDNYYDLFLNGNGITYIQNHDNGNTCIFNYIIGWDLNNSFTGTWVTDGRSGVYFSEGQILYVEVTSGGYTMLI